ncbi:KAP family P-loop NTPase fold protein [Uniformispora flossi]|uniref:KAP family P-loop NTPase fold protein n=1 Tax=Uniformispora flossi TaxID=3390723 RepID=UPI003C2C84CD
MTLRNFFDDSPSDGSADRPDLLDRTRYAAHAVSVLNRAREQTDSAVAALVGPWGSGKSSVLDMIRSQVQQSGTSQRSWVVAEFNPWLYPDLESIAHGLFAEIREALPRKERWSEARETLARYVKAISPVGKVVTVLGVDGSVVVEKAADVVAGDASASALQRRASEALRKADTSVLVIMDDLDRLTPSELLLVFKLVRLAGRLPNVHYLLGYDERTLLDVLRRTDLVSDDESRARDFLEKMVQIRLDLPAFRSRDVLALVEQAIDALIASHGFELRPDHMERLRAAYDAQLADRLDTPRAIKRYFAQVDAGFASVMGNVDVIDFLLVTFLRTTEPVLYATLARSRALLLGELILPAQDPDVQERLWRSLLDGSGVAPAHCDGVLYLLRLLFPVVGRTVPPVGAFSSYPGRGVGTADYFDRYFAFGVPADDLPEAVFDEALQQLATGAQGASLLQFRSRFIDDTARIVRRLVERHQHGDPLPNSELLLLFANHYPAVASTVEPLGFLDPTRAVQYGAGALLAALPIGLRESVLVDMASTAAGFELALHALGRVVAPDQGFATWALRSDLQTWVTSVRARLVDMFEHHAALASTRAIPELTDHEVTLLRLWPTFEPAAAQPSMCRTIESGAWSLLDLVARLMVDAANFEMSSSSMLMSVEQLVGLDYTFSRLTTEIDAAPDAPPTENGSWRPSVGQRRVGALTALRRRRTAGPAATSTAAS